MNLAYNRLWNIEGLEQLVNLEYLSLRGNKITDITPLKALTNLKELHIAENPIPDEQVAELERCLDTKIWN